MHDPCSMKTSLTHVIAMRASRRVRVKRPESVPAQVRRGIIAAVSRSPWLVEAVVPLEPSELSDCDSLMQVTVAGATTPIQR